MAQEKSKNKSADQKKSDQVTQSEKTASATAPDSGNSAEGEPSSPSQAKGKKTSDANPHGQKNSQKNSQKNDPKNDQKDSGQKQEAQNTDDQKSDGDPKVRPEVRRRTAGPARQRIAANDDTPSIGGLIYALQQRPSNQPFLIAGGVTAFWLTLTVFLSWSMLAPEIESATGFWDFLARPTVLAATGTIIIPIVLIWFLALLTWRTQELRLMSSAMTEVAVRLAEPDRMSEQAVASLGQSVRRQVAAMNDGISRALGRASELETLVHNEVSALEGSYSDNELRIRTLIDELASEREAITNNSDRVSDAIRGVGTEVTRQIEEASVVASDKLINVSKSINNDLQTNSDRTATLISEKGNTLLQSLNTVSQRISTEVPGVIHQLGQEQARLTKLIEDAGHNLVGLQTSLSERTGRLEGSLGRQTQYLEKVLKDYTQTVDTTIMDRAKALDAKLIEHTTAIGTTLDSRTQAFNAHLTQHSQTLGEHVKAIDHTLDHRAKELDANLVMRTKAIDAAFSQRIKTIDNAITQSTNQIDQSFSAKARLLQQAMSNHGKALNEALSRQSSELDNTLLQGVDAIQKTSERITTQSIKTIEGLASQAEFLEDVSSGLMHKINSLTNRFENQSESIKTAAHQVEMSNRKVDTVLEARHTSLNNLLENMSAKTDNLDRVVENYSSRLEASLGDAEVRALSITEQIAEGTAKSSAAVRRELELLRDTADNQAEETLLNLRNRFTQVGDEVNSQLATLSSKVADSTTDMHARTSQAARDLDLTRSQLKDRLAALSTDVSATTQHLQSHTDQAAQHIQQTQADLGKRVEAMSNQAAQHIEQTQANMNKRVDAMSHQAAQNVEQTQANLSKRVEAMSDQLGQTTRGIQERTDQAALEIQRTQEELNQRMALMSEQLGDTTKSVRDRTEMAALEIEQMRSKVYEQIDKLPQTARDGAIGMRSALQDQLKALDSLSAFAQQQASGRDISLPDHGPDSSQAAIERRVAASNVAPNAAAHAASHAATYAASAPNTAVGNNRLQDISQSLTQQMANRQQPAPTAGGNHATGATAPDGGGWSLGDLLARASDDEAGHSAHHTMAADQQGGQASGPGGMNFEHIAGAIDIVTAHQIWSRFRAGERGVLAREIYSEHGQITFDEIMKRYGQEPTFKASVDRYLVDYENLLREARTRDPKGKMVEKYLISETGRVYLLLAHASGRIA